MAIQLEYLDLTLRLSHLLCKQTLEEVEKLTRLLGAQRWREDEESSNRLLQQLQEVASQTVSHSFHSPNSRINDTNF